MPGVVTSAKRQQTGANAHDCGTRTAWIQVIREFTFGLVFGEPGVYRIVEYAEFFGDCGLRIGIVQVAFLRRKTNQATARRRRIEMLFDDRLEQSFDR